MTMRPPTTETRIVLRTILSAGVLAVLLACAGTAAGATWVVDDGGGAGVDYMTIQAAVDAASAGDTVEVRSGMYVENVDVGKRLTLVGDGVGVVTVQAASSNDHIFDVTADRVNISGFKVTGATGDGKAGIYVGSGIAHSNISNSTASNNYYGIYLDRSSNNILTENTPSKNSMHGIRLAYSSGNVLKNNIVSSDNGCAILLYASVDNRLINNDVSNSFQGIYMYTSSNDNLVSGNTASNNQQGGIYLEGNNNTITGNTASNNGGFGIALESSSSNTLYHNNLDGNTNNNAYDDGTNQWDSGSEGNYYSDYTGTDSDGDGIGDTSYPIPGGSSVDRYPLMEPWSEPTPTGSVHNINKGTDYVTIQAAINDADIGDEIHVDSGTYIENVDVYKQLTLIGEGADVVTVRAADSGDHVFNVTANYVKISGFNATGATASHPLYATGIYLSSADHCDISENAASNNYRGICLSSSSNNALTNNTANSNNNYGICLSSSSNNTLTNNTANSKTQFGIHLSSSSNNTLTNNTANSNNYGIYLYHLSNNNNLTSNTANSNNNYGIYLSRSNSNTLVSNTADSNNYGIVLFYSSNNTLVSNTADSNNHDGIGLFYSSDNTLVSNTASNNNDGIGLYSSSDYSDYNTIYHNTLTYNTNHNAYDEYTNQWDNGAEGNYYGDDYTGTDSDGDGIGDTPYPIPGGSSEDRYPLMVPYSMPGKIQLPQTGQIKCYDTIGKEIDCVGTGQDGDIRAGVAWPTPRFVDNGDGTITDMLTGLMWLKDGNCFGPQTWYDSLAKITDFNAHPDSYNCQDYTAHYTDWRLPNINELESLLNTEQEFPSTWLNDQGFRNVQYDWYWSSTTRATATNSAWSMSMMVGWVSSHSKGGTGVMGEYLLPVRSGQFGSPDHNYPANIWKTGQQISYYSGDDGDLQAGVSWPANRFADSGDGTVTDYLTGLMWVKDAGSPSIGTCTIGSMTWQDALDYVDCLNSNNYLSYNDWRLPNRKELYSLIDFSQHGPALPVGHPFTDLQSPYWSSTTVGANPYSQRVAWQVRIMDEGSIGGDWKWNEYNYNYFAWHVRSGLSVPPPTTYSVGQGAPDLVTKNHFIDAYNRNGGVNVLGSPTTEVHEAWGYLVQDFPGTSEYAGGIIMYNPNVNYA